MSEAEPVLARMWQALGEDEAHLALVAPGGYPALPSHLAVAALTRDAVAAASLAAALLAHPDVHPDVHPDSQPSSAGQNPENSAHTAGASPLRRK